MLILDQIGNLARAKDSWSETVEAALKEFRFSQLSAEIVRRGTPMSIATAGKPSASEVTGIAWPGQTPSAALDVENRAVGLREPVPVAQRRWGRSDDSHRPRASENASGGSLRFTHDQAQGSGLQQCEALELVEHLDDLVFDAIAGLPAAFTRLAQFWPQALCAWSRRCLPRPVSSICAMPSTFGTAAMARSLAGRRKRSPR